VSTFRLFVGASASTAYTVMLLLLSAMTFVPGDARVEMKRELAEGKKQHSEVLVIDAFGGDAAPTHLIGC